MQANLSKYGKGLVADIGSMSKHGAKSYRDFCTQYIGIDIEKGPNVDLVMTGPYTIPMADQSVDTVISGQCLEHVNNPFKLVLESARILKQGGYMLLTAPFQWREHRYPVDTFRYLPDGMRALMEEAGMTVIKTYLNQNDCWGIARKP
jgi:ubiquinone/menaquinone biosynthesis C-methylase UbiE